MIAMISAMLLLAGALDSATAVTIQRTTLDPQRSGHSRANDNAPPRYPTVLPTATNEQFGLLLERVQTLEELVQDNRRKVQRPSKPNHPSSRSFANAAIAVPTDMCGCDSLTRAAAPGSGGRGAGGAVCRDGERGQGKQYHNPAECTQIRPTLAQGLYGPHHSGGKRARTRE